MSIKRRIYVSMPSDKPLTEQQNRLKWAIVDKITAAGYIPEIFSNPRFIPGSMAANSKWEADRAYDVANCCVGGVVIGLPRWKFKDRSGSVKLPSEFCHYEGALLHTMGLPMLILVQEDAMRRTVFDYNFGPNIGVFGADADESWLATNDFLTPFNYWQEALSFRRDVFLGYCSKSSETAKAVTAYLNASGVSVLDWQEFSPGDSILQQIAKASEKCNAGIFLFTKDDELATQKEGMQAAPRDNVIFEAGYFIYAKGKEHVLIIKEEGAKMPADLGGDIYADLPDKADITPIHAALQKFIKNL